jgi:hypothetical protein
MKKSFTLSKACIGSLFLYTLLMFFTSPIKAQITCNNATTIWSEDFGTGTTATSSPDVLTTGLVYQAAGSLKDEGCYRVINNTQQKPEWQVSPDHTGNTDGKMLVVNGQAEKFFQHTITDAHGFISGDYTVSLFIMNVDTSGICAPNPLLPIITFQVEYLDETGSWVLLSNSPYTAAAIPQTSSPTWVNIGAKFNLPPTGAFFPTQIRITLGDGTIGGCGNDFAIDDINFSLCPAGDVAPVTLTSFTARHNGNGVTIEWSTSQELNNNYFQVERSADGSTNWSVIATVMGAGNSQVVNNYNSYDASPLSGVNYYRLKQVDNDGKYVYSNTVTVKIDLQKTAISVLANPFYNTLSVNFVSLTSQTVTARLVDITGKQVAVEKWSVYNGTTKKDFTNVSDLQHGMYILSIINNTGEILFNGKVVKQ